MQFNWSRRYIAFRVWLLLSLNLWQRTKNRRQQWLRYFHKSSYCSSPALFEWSTMRLRNLAVYASYMHSIFWPPYDVPHVILRTKPSYSVYNTTLRKAGCSLETRLLVLLVVISLVSRLPDLFNVHEKEEPGMECHVRDVGPYTRKGGGHLTSSHGRNHWSSLSIQSILSTAAKAFKWVQ